MKGTQGAHEQCANSLLKWVSEVMDKCRQRSFPMIFTDLNDEIGLQLVENEWTYIETPTAGSQDAGREGHVGYEFRTLMNLHHMSIANTFLKREPTYWGPNWNTSRIDFVVLPSEAMKFAEAVNVMHRAGKDLQVIPTKEPRDHFPVHIHFKYRMTTGVPHSTNWLRWDRHSLAEGVCQGRYRREFVKEVETQLRGHTFHHSPDQMFHIINSVIMNAGQVLFKETTHHRGIHKLERKARQTSG